jgi:hypothetical protein
MHFRPEAINAGKLGNGLPDFAMWQKVRNTWYVVYCFSYNLALRNLIIFVVYTVFHRIFYEWLIVYVDTVSAINDCCCFLLNHCNDEQTHPSLDNFCLRDTTDPRIPLPLHTENPKPLSVTFNFFLPIDHQPKIRKTFFLCFLGYLFENLKKVYHLEV